MDRGRLDALLSLGARRGEPPAVALRHHLLEGLLRRLARLPEMGGFVLRGGLMTRAWLATLPEPVPRPTQDLDLVGDFPFSVEDATARFRALLEVEVDDGVWLDRRRLRSQGIWLDTDFPGVRVTLAAGLGSPGTPPVETLTVDIGFGDPLVPADERLVYPALLPEPAALVRACRPETQVAWKLHGLSERGAAFRPKDLADLWWLARQPGGVTLDDAALGPAIEAAFVSRAFTLEQAATVLTLPHWGTKAARVRWAARREPSHTGSVPELAEALTAVRRRLDPVLSALVGAARGEGAPG